MDNWKTEIHRAKKSVNETDFGNTKELSDIERQETGYPASRAGLIGILHSVVLDLYEFGHITLATEEMIREVLSREES